MSRVEVVLDEEGLRHCQWSALLQRVVDDSALICYDDLLDDDEMPLESWVPSSSIRPPPPPPPPDFLEKLQEGDPLDLWHSDGWWEVIYDGSHGAQHRVSSREYKTEYLVAESMLRPRWRFCRTHWQAEAPHGLVVIPEGIRAGELRGPTIGVIVAHLDAASLALAALPSRREACNLPDIGALGSAVDDALELATAALATLRRHVEERARWLLTVSSSYFLT